MNILSGFFTSDKLLPGIEEIFNRYDIIVIMNIQTQNKIRKLENEIAAIWNVIDDERLWHPSVMREIKRRSEIAHRAYTKGKLRSADKIFGSFGERR